MTFTRYDRLSPTQTSQRSRPGTWPLWLLTGLGAAALVAALALPGPTAALAGHLRLWWDQLWTSAQADARTDAVAQLAGDDEAARLAALQQLIAISPTVSLGAHGDAGTLDACDGTFTVLDYYSASAAGEADPGRRIPQTAAAHNSCGGDTLLGWEAGQTVNVRGLGEDGLWQVTDARIVPKSWSTTDDLRGLGGDLALQSCFYGEDRMKIVGMTKLGG